MRGTRVTGWRRIAAAVWRDPADPQIFGALDIEAEPMLAFIEHTRSAGVHLTPTHLVGRAVGHALALVPEVNVQIRGGRSYQRDAVEVFFITAVDGGHDLSGTKIANVDRLTAVDVARVLSEQTQRLKAGHDQNFARTKRLTDALPLGLLRVALRAVAFVTQNHRRDVASLGLRRCPFGSAMVSSVGMLGLPHGFVPLASMYGVPLLVLVGELTEKALVVDGRVQARKVLPITATIDHRYADGWHISRLMRAFGEYLAAPENYEPSLPVPRQAERSVR